MDEKPLIVTFYDDRNQLQETELKYNNGSWIGNGNLTFSEVLSDDSSFVKTSYNVWLLAKGKQHLSISYGNPATGFHNQFMLCKKLSSIIDCSDGTERWQSAQEYVQMSSVRPRFKESVPAELLIASITSESSVYPGPLDLRNYFEISCQKNYSTLFMVVSGEEIKFTYSKDDNGWLSENLRLKMVSTIAGSHDEWRLYSQSKSGGSVFGFYRLKGNSEFGSNQGFRPRKHKFCPEMVNLTLISDVDQECSTGVRTEDGDEIFGIWEDCEKVNCCGSAAVSLQPRIAPQIYDIERTSPRNYIETICSNQYSTFYVDLPDGEEKLMYSENYRLWFNDYYNLSLVSSSTWFEWHLVRNNDVLALHRLQDDNQFCLETIGLTLIRQKNDPEWRGEAKIALEPNSQSSLIIVYACSIILFLSVLSAWFIRRRKQNGKCYLLFYLIFHSKYIV